jgi:hypothetical protein
MPTYSEAEIRKRVGSGTDAKRARKVDSLFAKATQPPHEDDAQALAQLRALSGDDSTGGFATNDARNYARMRLNTLPGATPLEYSEARDGGGFFGSLGGVLKTAAPFAGLIPGVGPLLGAGLAAGGSALGGELSGDDFNLGKTLLAGGAGYLGGKLNPFGGGGGAVAGAAGTGTQSMPGIAAQASTPGYAGGGGILGKLGIPTGGGGLLDKALQHGPMILGGLAAANRQHEADQMMQEAVRGARQDWQSRAPLRDFASSQIMSTADLQAPDVSHIFADPSNPYNRVRNPAVVPLPLTTRYRQ